MGLTSPAMFLSVIIPLPFDIATTAIRFWIRYRRNAWGAGKSTLCNKVDVGRHTDWVLVGLIDDWATLITLVSNYQPQRSDCIDQRTSSPFIPSP